ncbi:hypothetical protein J6590_078616 [Homalodisca vitripennis]|nr:hypothetical protein J6590_078616 [Homalodisca vitripennis]
MPILSNTLVAMINKLPVDLETSEERVTDFVLSTSDAQNLGGFAVKGREAAEGDETQLLVELRHVYNVSFETFFN